MSYNQRLLIDLLFCVYVCVFVCVNGTEILIRLFCYLIYLVINKMDINFRK